MQLVPLLDSLVGWIVDRDPDLCGCELWPDGTGRLVALPRRPSARRPFAYPRRLVANTAAVLLGG